MFVEGSSSRKEPELASSNTTCGQSWLLRWQLTTIWKSTSQIYPQHRQDKLFHNYNIQIERIIIISLKVKSINVKVFFSDIFLFGKGLLCFFPSNKKICLLFAKPLKKVLEKFYQSVFLDRTFWNIFSGFLWAIYNIMRFLCNYDYIIFINEFSLILVR